MMFFYKGLHFLPHTCVKRLGHQKKEKETLTNYHFSHKKLLVDLIFLANILRTLKANYKDKKLKSYIGLLILLSLPFITSLKAEETLRFIGFQNYATGEKFNGTEIGGLSGIVYDQMTKKLLAVSDDRGFVNEPRFYEFDLILNEKTFKVTPSKVTKLKTKELTFFKKGYADFEAITLLKDGDILISSEGGINKNPPLNPEVIIFSANGDYKSQLTIDDKFLPYPTKSEATRGPRDNQSFETLNLALDGKTLFLATEESLFQDGPTTTANESSLIRIILHKDLKAYKEVAYPLEKIDALKGVDLSPGTTGLTDIAAIDENNFYTLERTYLPFQNKNIIRIFRCQINSETTDVADLASLAKQKIITVKKTLVADLDDFMNLMTPASLDNIEGIAFGPDLENKNKTLIVVSDNNFGKTQRTLLMAFEINPINSKKKETAKKK